MGLDKNYYKSSKTWTHLTVATMLLDNLSSVKFGSKAPDEMKKWTQYKGNKVIISYM